MDIKSMLGNIHRLPLSHMAKSYIWLKVTNQRINDFSIGYMMNPNLIINKYFKQQARKCMKKTFGTTTQQHINKVLSKKYTGVLALFMFYETRQKNLRNISKC